MLLLEVVRRRTDCEYALSSGQHLLAGGRWIPKSATPSRRALNGGRHQFLLGLSSPEQTRDGDSYLLLGFVRRRTACESALSSGQHSLAGGRRIPNSPTPSRGALTGGRHQFLLGWSSPEMGRAQNSHLWRVHVRRRIGCESTRSSGKKPVIGGHWVTGTAAPVRQR